jgi:hypothetical protein
MKTTVDIHDELLVQAKQYAQETGRSLRAVVEEGLRQLLRNPPTRPRYTLPDLSAGVKRGHDPLEACSWQELRESIYGRPESD